MSNTWPKTSFVKVHEGCGGIVRWVEALDKPAVHYTGECRQCGREDLTREEILPIRIAESYEEARKKIRQMTVEERAKLEWDEDDEWKHNQQRLTEEVGVASL